MTTTLKDNTVVLPKTWKGARVFIHASKDTLVIKKIQPSSFWETWKEIKPLTKDITPNDIKKAVAQARRK